MLSLQVNQLVELPTPRLQKKVKSMQMFRKPVSIARYIRYLALLLKPNDRGGVRQ